MISFRDISTVPSATEFIDVILSKTQRKTPTQLHAREDISKARVFYIKKVTFIGNELDDRLGRIIKEFPEVDRLHPFYTDILNIMFDRDAYKQCLGHVSTTRSIGKQIVKEHQRALKYAETHYRAKSLKRACFGRLTNVVLRLKSTLQYLEGVRQNLSRLPSVDPTANTLLMAGCPNVGKSSFVNAISRAVVDVRPFAFTTTSLIVGHFDYSLAKWQVVDTPGVLDADIESRGSVEMLAVAAIAHLRACVLFVLDLSTACGFSIDAQIDLCEGMEPLLGTALVVLNKVDIYKIPSPINAETLIVQHDNDNQHSISDLNVSIPLKSANSSIDPQFFTREFINRIDEIDSQTENKAENLKSLLSNVDTLKNDPNTLNRLCNFLSKRKITAMSTETLDNIDNVKKKGCKILEEAQLVENAQDQNTETNLNIIRPKKFHPQETGELKISKDEADFYNTSRYVKHGKNCRSWSFIDNNQQPNQENGLQNMSSLSINDNVDPRLLSANTLSQIDLKNNINTLHSSENLYENKPSNVQLLERHKYEMDPTGYIFDQAKNYVCENGHDVVPEFFYGKNISDFINKDTAKTLELISNEEILENPTDNIRNSYNLLSKEEREYIQTIRIRQRAKEIEHSMNQRSAMPQKWIENRNKKESQDVKLYSNLVKQAPEKIKRNTFMKTDYLRYYNRRPKHLNVSSRGKKGSLYR